MEPYQPTVMEVLMRQNKQSQSDVGYHVGKDQASISNIITKSRSVDDELRGKIADAIGLKHPELLLDAYDPNLQEFYRGSSDKFIVVEAALSRAA